MIYIIRHGQTELNSRHVLQGRSDAPLNETGIAQAREAAERLRARGIVFGRVYSSPLRRAVQTAELIAPGVMIALDARLIEMDYGPYEGMDLRAPAPEVRTFFSDFVHNPAPPGMEPLDSVVRRAGSFLASLDARTDETILISTHAIAMKGLLEYLTPASRGSFWSKHIVNCAVYGTERTGDGFTIPQELDLSE